MAMVKQDESLGATVAGRRFLLKVRPVRAGLTVRPLLVPVCLLSHTGHNSRFTFLFVIEGLRML